MNRVLGRVAAINRYPVKSMQGESLASALLTEHGIVGDRQWALRDLTTGKIISAKVPKLGIPLLTCGAVTQVDGSVSVTVDGLTAPVTQVDAVLTQLLGRDVRMEQLSGADEVYASEWPEIEDTVLSGMELDLSLAKGSYADLSPLHLLTSSSLAHLNTLAEGSNITANRFRPGILIETDPTTEAFVENNWNAIRVSVGSAELLLGAASPRCIMTTLPQPVDGLDRDPAVLQAIAKHNRRDFGGFGNFACLGVYADVARPGSVAVGDELVVLD
jgi:uncharacterized protein